MMQLPTAAVLGYPIKQSLSPPMHNYWLQTMGIPGMYLPMEIKPDDLKDVLLAMPKLGFVGCNLTIPHKEAAMALVQDISETAKAIGAVNTLQFNSDETIYATNTDAEGFLQNLKYHHHDLSRFKQQALVIGAGGASRAIIYALQQEGFQKILIANRTRSRADALAEHFGVPCETLDWAETEAAMAETTLLVNTSSLGMGDDAPWPLALDALPKDALVTDIVYKPLMTGLLKAADARGNPIVTGVGMLAHQGVPGFELWFGARPHVDEDVLSLLEASL